MEKLSILINKTYLSRSKLERDEEERRAVVRDEKKSLSNKHKCEEAEG
jgi:protein-arginine kinase activator protein McsA